MINIARPVIEEEEIAAVNEVLTSGTLAQGPKVAELEADFAKYCGTKYAVAVNSGTAAIHAALFAAGVGEGDEVITVPFSFIATINPILMVGAKPVLVDIEPETFTIDVAQIESVITDKTKAIMPVHLYGQPCNWDELQAIADKHDLKIIEDACQAVGASYGEKRAGGLGNAGCFSLYATKNIMCGEGGVVTTDDETYYNAMRRFRQHGMSGPYQYEHIGYNYRMTDLQAAIAVEQLKKSDGFNEKRQANAAFFDKELAGIKGVILPTVAEGRTHVYHQYTVRITDECAVTRTEFIEQLKARNVGAGVYYPKPLHFVEHIAKIGYKEGDFPVTEQLAEEVVSLPIHPALTQNDLNQVVAAIKEVAHA